MAQNESDYEFYVGPATHLEGASLAIDGTARIDGKIVGKVAVKHHCRSWWLCGRGYLRRNCRGRGNR